MALNRRGFFGSIAAAAVVMFAKKASPTPSPDFLDAAQHMEPWPTGPIQPAIQLWNFHRGEWENYTPPSSNALICDLEVGGARSLSIGDPVYTTFDGRAVGCEVGGTQYLGECIGIELRPDGLMFATVRMAPQAWA